MVLVVGIAGGSASGKTTIARKAAENLGKNALILSQDRFYKSHSEIPEFNGEKNFDCPESFDWELIKNCIASLKNSRDFRAPIYEYENGRTGFEKIHSAEIIIFEGILALHDNELNKEMDLKFFVNAPEAERFARRIKRDCIERNISQEKVRKRLEEHVRPMHDLHIEPLKQKAGFELDGTKNEEFKKVVEEIGKINDFMLEISLRECNLNCNYCKRENNQERMPKISNEEIIEILQAAKNSGIKRVRWTGGEPTINQGFLRLARKAKELGFSEQCISTNGTTLFRNAEALQNCGISRANISLDTLDREKFAQITGFDFLPQVLQSIEKAAEFFETVKIHFVLSKQNLQEIPKIINFIKELSERNRNCKIAVRFLELIPGGFEKDAQFVKKEYVPVRKAVEAVRKEFGQIRPVFFKGDNPKSEYFEIMENKVVFGILPQYSIDFECDPKKCRKIRVNPTGQASNCIIFKEFGKDLNGKSASEKEEIMKSLVLEKKQRSEGFSGKNSCFPSEFDFWKFGKLAEN